MNNRRRQRMVLTGWKVGLSAAAVVGIAAQVLLLLIVLGVAGFLLDPHVQGWFADPHDHALLWKDAAGVVAVVCLIPLAVAVVSKRLTAVKAQVAIAAIAILALCVLVPATGLGA